jgi:hypothetical protein
MTKYAVFLNKREEGGPFKKILFFGFAKKLREFPVQKRCYYSFKDFEQK